MNFQESKQLVHFLKIHLLIQNDAEHQDLVLITNLSHSDEK